MKKILFALLLTLPLVFISCSDDDDDYSPSDLVGEWEWVASEGWYYDNGKKVTYNESLVGDDEPTYMTFNENGTGEEHEVGYGIVEFTWSLSGNKLTIKTKYETTVEKIVKLDAKKYVVESNGTDDGEEYFYKNTYTKLD